jgi:uncharacterized RDD family membrane protein YckC
MPPEIVAQLKNLCISATLTGLIVLYYRNARYPISDRYLTFAPRFWAGFVDTLVLWPTEAVFAVLLSLDLSTPIAASLVLAHAFVWPLYTVTMHARHGQTVGKMATRVRIVNCRTEEKIAVWRACLREAIPSVLVLGIAAYQAYALVFLGAPLKSSVDTTGIATIREFQMIVALPTLWLIAEIMTMLTNKKCRALHDLIAGTVVIRTNTERKADDRNTPENILEHAAIRLRNGRPLSAEP